ncbi:translocator protein 2 isoform X1 [Balaenoptera acutorostrata]|uniref:Translocator protein n=2 Tax=Balaenoptera acutorostrata TaxID=9767 RepID=A0A384BE16_BALAC|nr:translocator protein 2 isoform X1 [Balaenoptera acutorostrata]
MQAAAWTPQPVSPPLSLEKGRPARSPTPPFSPSPTLLCPPHILHPQHSVWEVCCLSVFSPSPDCTSSRRMWPQGAAFVALPLLGPTLVWLLTHHWMSGWCDSPRRLPWCPSHRVLLLVWTAIYSITGYASYLVWKDLGGGFGRPLALPLGLYAVQLAISWTVLVLLFTAHTPGLALLHLLLLFGLVVSTALIWHPINKLAALLLLPYLAWLTVVSSITYRLWRDSLCPEHQPQPTWEKSD